METIKLCLIGAGSIGKRHLRLLGERKDVELYVCEPSEVSRNRLIAELGNFPMYDSLDDVIADGKCDGVIIATPHQTHADLSIKAMEAGLHVFCEKPMSDSLESCIKMLETAKKCDRVFSVGFMFHFDPFVRKVKELLDAGTVGTPLHFYSRFATQTTLRCSVTNHQKHTPYSLVMDCIHDTDLLCWLTGRIPDTVSVNKIQAGDLELTSDPNVIDITYGFGSGDFSAHAHMNYVQFPQVHTLQIFGDRGYIIGDFMSHSITYVGADEQVKQVQLDYPFDDVYRAEWDHFIGAIKGEHDVENPAHLAILPTLLMECQKQAGITDSTVAVKETAEKFGYYL